MSELKLTAGEITGFLDEVFPGAIEHFTIGRRLAVGDVLMYSEAEDMPCARASVTYAIPSSYVG